MNHDKVTFAVLDRFLRDLGFACVADGRGFAFHHKPSGAVIFLRKFTADEELSPTDLAIVRHHLDWYGLMTHAEFERRLHGGLLVV
jgi:hypothetical protein